MHGNKLKPGNKKTQMCRLSARFGRHTPLPPNKFLIKCQNEILELAKISYLAAFTLEIIPFYCI